MLKITLGTKYELKTPSPKKTRYNAMTLHGQAGKVEPKTSTPWCLAAPSPLLSSQLPGTLLLLTLFLLTSNAFFLLALGGLFREHLARLLREVTV